MNCQRRIKTAAISVLTLIAVLLPSQMLNAASSSSRTSRATVKQTTKKDFRLHLGGGLVGYSGTNGMGFNVSGLMVLGKEKRVHAGFETGLDILGSVGFGARIGMPLYATGYYELTSKPTDSFRPYLGASIGPRIGLSKAATRLAIFLRPGANVALNPKSDLNIEARFGALDGLFYIYPNVNFAIKL